MQAEDAESHQLLLVKQKTQQSKRILIFRQRPQEQSYAKMLLLSAGVVPSWFCVVFWAELAELFHQGVPSHHLPGPILNTAATLFH